MKSAIAFAALLMLSTGAVAAAGTSAKSQDPGDKMRCKRLGETGSLVRVKKVCRTDREWRELRDQAQRDGDTMQQNSRITASGPN